jgi:hypothetical protein
LSNLIYEVCADGDIESDAETDAEDAPIQEVRAKRTEENQFRRKKLLRATVGPSLRLSARFLQGQVRKTTNLVVKDFSALKRLLKSQSKRN